LQLCIAVQHICCCSLKVLLCVVLTALLVFCLLHLLQAWSVRRVSGKAAEPAAGAADCHAAAYARSSTTTTINTTAAAAAAAAQLAAYI
jgi:hypothetical protein